MRTKNYYLFLCTFFLLSCSNFTTQPPDIDTVSPRDSSREKLANALYDIIKSNATPGDTTISGSYNSQGRYDNGSFYISVTTGKCTINLITASLLKEEEVMKLKKDGNNMVLTYNPSDMKVKFLSMNFEPEK